jgi:hypothetical protein
MANYYATTRSNYFRVKDNAAFEAWCAARNLKFWTKDIGEMGTCYAISADTMDCGGWPSHDPEEDADIDFTAELALHLNAKDIAVLFETGAEKLRYITGEALAVHSDGRVVELSLHEIYERAEAEFGADVYITNGSY